MFTLLFARLPTLGRYGVFYFYCCYLMVAPDLLALLRWARRKLCGGATDTTSLINEEGVKPLPTAVP